MKGGDCEYDSPSLYTSKIHALLYTVAKNSVMGCGQIMGPPITNFSPEYFVYSKKQYSGCSALPLLPNFLQATAHISPFQVNCDDPPARFLSHLLASATYFVVPICVPNFDVDQSSIPRISTHFSSF
jgi:hypothetical protein